MYGDEKSLRKWFLIVRKVVEHKGDECRKTRRENECEGDLEAGKAV